MCAEILVLPHRASSSFRFIVNDVHNARQDAVAIPCLLIEASGPALTRDCTNAYRVCGSHSGRKYRLLLLWAVQSGLLVRLMEHMRLYPSSHPYTSDISLRVAA